MRKQAHQCADFGFGTLPILGAEGVKGQVLDADFAGGLEGGFDGFGSGAVPFDPRFAAVCRPATVAIHDDGDVLRDRFFRIECSHVRMVRDQRMMVCSRAGPTPTMLTFVSVSSSIRA